MPPIKPLSQREKELQILLATPAGRQELQKLESRYHSASGRFRPASTSVITYILVHEREQGLIDPLVPEAAKDVARSGPQATA